MNITIIGSGYVGLVTGSCLAALGHRIVCVDTDAKKIDSLRLGRCPIHEPDLERILGENLSKGRLAFTTHIEEAVPDAEVVFISVGTPSSRRGNGYADLNYVHEAARTIAPHLRQGTVVAMKSTVPVGSARDVARIIRETNSAAEFEVASNPEFLREGAAVYDFMHPDRIVLGVDSNRTEKVLKAVYEPLSPPEIPFVVTTPETAELTKYAANAFLAAKVSFINEIANLCEIANADVVDVANGMGLDVRIGPKFLNAGPGFGGSCFPKDTVALARIAQEKGAPCRIVETVIEVNNAQKARMVGKIRKALGETTTGKRLAVLGLTFKPETDDIRETPALTIIPALVEKGIRVRAHDPMGMEEARKILPEIEYAPDPYAACEGANAVCLMTEWEVYRTLDLERLKKVLAEPVVIDLRNVYQPEVMKKAGFRYISIGRQEIDGRS